MKRFYFFLALFFVAVLLAACAPRGQAPSASEAAAPAVVAASASMQPTPVPAPPPIWRTDVAASPLQPVVMTPGEVRRVSLRGAAKGTIEKITSVTARDSIGLSFTVADGDTLEIAAGGGGKGVSIVRAAVQLAGGGAQTVAFPVAVKQVPLVEFQYTPPAGKKPAHVYLAGSFNGWSMNRDEFLAGADGVFRIRKAIAPGSHTYKFVVDGEWMSDPGNPKTDDSGYGNSLLRVEGEARQPIEFSVLSKEMPGAGAQGGFEAALDAGDRLDPATLAVIVNNREMTAAAWELAADGRRILLKIPQADWGEDNNVMLLAQSASGRLGTAQAQFSYRAAARRPQDEIIYYAMTDRFCDGDASRNAPTAAPRVKPLANYLGGDWAGITRKVNEGYFDSLGVSTIWISPPNRNTQKVEQESIPPGRFFTSYHGYWPISQTETNEQFGSMDDLKTLVRSAHERRMAVLLDFVANHVHEDNPLYKEHPEWAAPLTLPDGRKNIRLFDEFPLTTWFDTFLPTLDYERFAAIRTVMVDSAVYWLRESGADGFRHDAVKHIPTEFWRDLTAALHREIEMKEGRAIYQVGESISGYDTVARYVGPDLMSGQFDFPGYFTLRNVLALERGSMTDMADSLKNAAVYYPACGVMSTLLGNHDFSRFMAYADGDVVPDSGVDEKEIGYTNPPRVDRPDTRDKLRLAFAWLMTTPGAPMIFYGDEIGMTGAGDPDNRRPMVWGGLTDDQRQMFEAVAALGHARQASIALRRGWVQPIYADAERVVFARVSPEETMLVVLSRRPASAGFSFELPASWGAPARLDPVVSAKTKCELQGRRVSVSDAAHGYGVWRVRWDAK